MIDNTARDERSLGPVWVSSQARPVEEQQIAEGLIDIAALRGCEVALTYSTIADLERCGRKVIHKLVEYGVLESAGSSHKGRRLFVRYDISKSLADYYFEWISRTPGPTLVTHEDFERYRQIRRWCKVSADEPHPDIVVDAVCRKLLEIGNFGFHEVNGLIPLVHSGWSDFSTRLKQRICAYAIKNRRLRVFMRKACAIQAEVPVSWDLFKAALPDEFLNLPQTCLDPNPRNQRDRPALRFRERAWKLTRLFDLASLFAIVQSARERRPNEMLVGFHTMDRIEEIMFTYKPDGRWMRKDYAAAIERYAIDQDILPLDSDATRLRTVYTWRLILERLRRYCALHDPHNERGIRQLLPPRFRISRLMKAKLTARYAYLAEQTVMDRKEDAHQAFADLDLIHEAARNRRDEMQRFGNALRVAEQQIGAEELFVDFSVQIPTLDSRGIATGDEQIEMFRMWRNDAAWRSFKSHEAPFTRTRHSAQNRERKGFRDGFVVEHLWTRGVDGSEPRTGWMIELSKLFVAGCPALLPVDVREARHEKIRDLGLPGFRSSGPGLIRFGADGGTLARCGLENGRSFIPLEQAEIAIRFAYIALDIVAQSYSRTHEIQQITRLGWTEVDVVPGKEHMRQEVLPKIEAGQDVSTVEPVRITVTAETITEILDICELHVTRCGLDDFPVMPASDSLAWKCAPAEYAISWAGRALHPFELNYFLRFLLAGWPPFTFHDFRHAEAEEDAFDGVEESIIQDSLGHKSVAATRIYTKLPNWASFWAEIRSDSRRAERLERKRAARKAAGANGVQVSHKRKTERLKRRRDANIQLNLVGIIS
jgi:hypothetical protein